MIALAWLLSADPASASEAARRYALLVGANDGGADRVALRYAHSDAETMGQVLTELGGIERADRTLLLDPSVGDLTSALDDLGERVATSPERAEVIFYYSGHSDGEGLLLGEEHLPYPELKAALEAVPAQVRLAILDSCASGALIRTKGGRRVAPFLVDTANDVDGLAYITSSSADEVSQEADQIGGSYFTHSLATGLRGAADQSGDGRVTLDEAYSFAYETTLVRTERSQYGPQHANRAFDLSGKGNLVLTDLHLTSASLVLDEDLSGRALVRDADGDLVAELIKPAGRTIELGLGAGSYEITFGKASDGRFALAQIELEVGTTAIVGLDDLVWYEAESTVARGDAPPPTTVVTPAAADPTPMPPRFELFPGFPPPYRDGSDSMIFGVVTRSQSIKGTGFALAASHVDDDLHGGSFALGTSTVGGSVDGVQGTLGFNLARGDTKGAQLTLGANVTGGNLRGAQVSLGGNWVRGEARGLQATLGVNSADRGSDGIQAALGANVAVGDVRGAQTSLGTNISTGRMRGFQGTLGANVAQDVAGLQASVGVNVAEDVGGMQLGGVNVAGGVRGGQIGLVNVGRDVRGLQLGLINVARKVDGVSLGLLTFEQEGRHDLLLYASETDWLNGEFKLGSRTFHTVFGAGGQPGQYVWLGLGWGGHATLGRAWLDIDAIVQSYVRPSDFTDAARGFQWPRQAPTFVTRTRLTLGVQIAKQFAVFGGLSLAVVPPGQDAPVAVRQVLADDDTSPLLLWPGAFAGVQF